MSDLRPFDPERDGPLLSAYADGELDAQDREQVEAWLVVDERAREELRRVVQMKAFTDHLALVPAPAEAWDEFHEKVYNRSERSIGWTLLGVGAAMVGLYLGVRLLPFILSLAVPVMVRMGLLLAAVGLLVLLVSAIRERLFTRKRDRYDDVRR